MSQYNWIEGNLLCWITEYLNHWSQITMVNSTQSDELNVTCGIPQGSVLGPVLLSLYTNDMPASVVSSILYLYADDSTIYSIGSTVNETCSLLNSWCMANPLIPHSAKCEAMLFYKGSFIGPYPVLTIGNETISWVCHAGLLGITIDHKLTWTKHLTELKENFVNKLNLLRKCSFLTKKNVF